LIALGAITAATSVATGACQANDFQSELLDLTNQFILFDS